MSDKRATEIDASDAAEVKYGREREHLTPKCRVKTGATLVYCEFRGGRWDVIYLGSTANDEPWSSL